VKRLAALRSRDLAAAMALALLGLIVSLLSVPGWLRAAVLLPAALAAPGYAIGAALFRPGAIPRGERLVLTIVFSISAAILGGLLVQLAIGLDRAVFASILFAVTVGAALLAGERRGPAGSPVEARFALPRLNPFSVAAIVAAMGLAAWGIEIATDGVYEQRRESHFSSLWMLSGEPPVNAGRPIHSVRLGVSSHEDAPVSYRLGVSQGPNLLKAWRFRLEPGQRWSRMLPTPNAIGPGRLVGRLYRGGAVYRTVSLDLARAVG
jgi:hypothetical protein